MRANDYRNAAVAVAAYYIGRAEGSADVVAIGKRTASSEGFTAPDDVWSDALQIVIDRSLFKDPA